jgi:hypothetical protein
MSEDSAASRRVGSKFDAEDELTSQQKEELVRRHADSLVSHRNANAVKEDDRAGARERILRSSVLFGAAAGTLSLAGAGYRISSVPRLRAQPAFSSFALFCSFFMPFTFVTNVSRNRMMKNAGFRGARG